MRRLLPVPVVDDLDLDALATHYAFPDDRPQTVRANMVSSIDGAIAFEGHAQPVSGDDDWYLFGLHRALADAIVVGAGTARTEAYGPGRARPEFAHLRERAGQPAAPTLVLVTRTGNLDADADYLGGQARPVVVTCAKGRDSLDEVAERADVIVCGEDEVDLAAALDELADRGLRRLLNEGGPHLLGSLLDDDRVDELVTSQSPVVVGGDAGRMVAGGSGRVRPFELVGLLESDGALFMHHRRGKDDS